MQFEPYIFVGSSSEGKSTAELIIQYIESLGDIAIPWWSPRVFEVGQSFLGSLYEAVFTYNAGLFVATADDLSIIRDKSTWTANGNVIMEYGLFLGARGPDRVTLATVGDVKLPSDLDGINRLFITIEDTSERNNNANLSPKTKQDIASWLEALRESPPTRPSIIKHGTIDEAFEEVTHKVRQVRETIAHAAFSPPIPYWETKASQYRKALADTLAENRIFYRYLAGIGEHRLRGIQQILTEFDIEPDPQSRRYVPCAIFQLGYSNGMNFHIFDTESLHIYVPGQAGEPGTSFVSYSEYLIRTFLSYFNSLWSESILVRGNTVTELLRLQESYHTPLQAKLQSIRSSGGHNA